MMILLGREESEEHDPILSSDSSLKKTKVGIITCNKLQAGGHVERPTTLFPTRINGSLTLRPRQNILHYGGASDYTTKKSPSNNVQI